MLMELLASDLEVCIFLLTEPAGTVRDMSRANKEPGAGVIQATPSIPNVRPHG